jgi:DNA-binding MarR family transcriptional regulator
MTATVQPGRLVDFLSASASTWQEVTDDVDGDALVTFGLVEAIWRAWRAVHREVLAGFGLNHAEWMTLTILRTSPGLRRSPTELRRLVEQTSAGMTRVLGKLGGEGLVRREPRPEDGRGQDVILTAKGRRLAEKSFRVLHARQVELLASYRARERAELIRTLDDLCTVLDRGAGRR